MGIGALILAPLTRMALLRLADLSSVLPVAAIVVAAVVGDLLSRSAACSFSAWRENAVSFFAFMALVQREQLSFAVPASSASFVLEILAKFVLHERISFRRAAGTVIVLAGVVLVGGWRAYWLTRTGAATGASGTTGTRQPCRM